MNLPPVLQQIQTIREDMAQIGNLLNKSAFNPVVRMTRNVVLANSMRQHIQRSLKEHAVVEKAESDSESESESEDYTIVFIWDLDVITMMSRKRMVEVSQQIPLIHPMGLHKMINKLLITLSIPNADVLAEQNVINVEDCPSGEQLCAQSLYRLKNVYNEVLDEGSMISQELLEKCRMDVEDDAPPCHSSTRVEGINTERWEKVRRCLDLVNRKSVESEDYNYANVVMSTEGIAQAAAQLIISGNSSAIPIENIYSTFGMFKSLVRRRIEQRFGDNCCYIYIASSYDSPEATSNYDFSVSANESIDFIYKVQQEFLR